MGYFVLMQTFSYRFFCFLILNNWLSFFSCAFLFEKTQKGVKWLVFLGNNNVKNIIFIISNNINVGVIP